VYPPENEDFGMVPIEAMASGTPVLGVHEGFTEYQIIDGQNGYLFEADADGIRRCLETFETDGVAWRADDIQAFAANWFGPKQWRDTMRRAVKRATDAASPDVPWQADQPTAADAEGREASAVTDGGEE